MEQQKQRPKQGRSLTRKIIEAHYVKGSLTPGEEVFLRVDQTLTHDINAVMTYLAFEAIGLPRVRTECSVSYLDHNLLYIDHKTPDDHIYLQSAARKYGVWVSRPGNGICHAVHAARFGVPGKICMGGDSHTPHGGAIGMLGIGVGGMDVATAMTGVPMRLKMPKVVNVRLTGSLWPGVNAKEVILELLRRVSIKGGLGKVYEVYRPRRGNAGGAAARHHRQHGCRDGRDQLHLSGRRTGEKVFDRTAPGRCLHGTAAGPGCGVR